MSPVGCSLNIFCRVGLRRKMPSSRALQGTVPGSDICASVCRLSEEEWSKAREFRECLDKLHKGQRLTEPAIRHLFHLLSDDGQPVPFYTLIRAFDWLGLQPHQEFLPQDGLVTEEVLVRMLTAECPRPVLAPPTASVPGPKMSNKDALRRGIWRMYVFLTGNDSPDTGLGFASQLYFASCLGINLPWTQRWMSYEALEDRLIKLATLEGVEPEDAEEVHGALATLGDPSRATCLQAEAQRLVEILAMPGPGNATRFTKFAEQVGLPIPAEIPAGGMEGKWKERISRSSSGLRGWNPSLKKSHSVQGPPQGPVGAPLCPGSRRWRLPR